MPNPVYLDPEWRRRVRMDAANSGLASAAETLFLLEGLEASLKDLAQLRAEITAQKETIDGFERDVHEAAETIVELRKGGMPVIKNAVIESAR